MSVYRLMQWWYSGSIVKSLQEMNHLVHDILLTNDFKVEDLSNFNTTTQNSILDRKCRDSRPASDGWCEVNINIEIPTQTPDSDTAEYHWSFTITSFLYQSLIDVLKSAFSFSNAKCFHLFFPFKHF